MQHSALLALDSMASEKSVRIAVYDRAFFLFEMMVKKTSVEEIADQIIEFVGGEKHRLEAFDVALKRMNRRQRMEALIEKAEEIAAWAGKETGESSLDDFPDDPPTATKKVIRKKARSR